MECKGSVSNNLDQRSTAIMPKALVVVAAVFMAARIVDFGISVAQAAQPKAVVQSIEWKDVPALTSASPASKMEAPQAPLPDLSPESAKELEKLVSESQMQHKYLVLEFYANWSDPCKKMEETSLSNKQVKMLVDDFFMPVRITDRLKETGKNPRLVSDLQKRFRVFAFPTLVILDNKGEPAATLVGNCSSLTTYRFLSRSLFSISEREKVRPIALNPQ